MVKLPGLRRRAGANGPLGVDRQIELPMVVPAYRVGRRGWGRRRVLLVAGVALGVLLLMGAVGYGVANTLSLNAAKDRLSADNARLQGQLSQLKESNSSLRTDNDALRRNNDSLLADVRDLHGQLNNPTLTIWTDCGGPCTMQGGNYYRAGGVPDTFDYYLAFDSTVPVTTYVMTLQQFAQFDNCGPGCITGRYTTYPASRHLEAVFKDAEGCASYVGVFVASGSGVIHPNVRAKYNPANGPTGVCAH